MTYLVNWSREAERRLNAIWRLAPDPERIFAAAMELEQRLRKIPGDEGESRDGDRRITFEAPLGILFKIIDSEREVVLVVWDYQSNG